MNIQGLSEELQECQDQFNELDAEARITYNQFELANLTEINDPTRWVAFLKDARVADSINEELVLFTEAQKRKLIARATTHDKSVGTAQMINSLNNANESKGAKSGGQIFVYSFVPLNAREINAPNTMSEATDIFELEG